jgi:hypothetical protein
VGEDDRAIDYRMSDWSLRAAHAPDDALARLEARPVGAEQRAALAASRFAIDPAAARRTGDDLVARGFRHLGSKGESAGYRPMNMLDVFIDPDETTYITYRARRSWRGLSRYYILTYFDDGSCIETTARSSPLLTTSEHHIVRPGHDDDIILDVTLHLDAVRAHVARGVRILPVRDLDTVKRLAAYIYGHVVSAEIASGVARTRERERSIALVFVAILAMLAWTIIKRR